MSEQKERPRAVFSINDLDLIKQLIREKLQTSDIDEELKAKLTTLYHRLGRI